MKFFKVDDLPDCRVADLMIHDLILIKVHGARQGKQARCIKQRVVGVDASGLQAWDKQDTAAPEVHICCVNCSLL